MDTYLNRFFIEAEERGIKKGEREGKKIGSDLLVEATTLLRAGSTIEELKNAGKFDEDIIKKALLLK